ncbi:Transposase DDE domain-containing protein [Nitrosomonas communis]|uniref:Transposase DDE domain-containing protein n=1 Tax=Nitrosomonas communis TaxID=44574 RepID=A0A1I4PLE4_9PROT|nr:Transposase DDE domain-containing protein [Nitrosomonas communis]
MTVIPYRNWRALCLINSLVPGITPRSHSLSNCGSRACSSLLKVRKNMKNKLLPQFGKLLLRKRSTIEIVNDLLKNISQIEYSRHRSLVNFFLNLIAGLVAYSLWEKKPSLNIRFSQALPVVGDDSYVELTLH